MKNETLLRGTIVALSLTLVIVVFFYSEVDRKYNELKTTRTFDGDTLVSKSTYEDVTQLADSLHDEIFQERVESGRHEITRDEVLSKYPKVKKEYELFYEHQTE
jgi:hypothetical protein